MKHKKIIILTSLLSTFAVAQAEPINIKILNNAAESNIPITIYNAQIRVDSGNNWIDIGNLNPGNNLKTVEKKEKNVRGGVLRGTLPNNKNIVASFTESSTDKVIELEINNYENTSEFKKLMKIENSGLKDMPDPELLVVKSNNTTSRISEYSGNLRDTNSWFANCSTLGVAGGTLMCTISSSPSLLFTADVTGAFMFNNISGSFATNNSVNELLAAGKSVTGSMGGAFWYAHGEFYGSGNVRAWFNGGTPIFWPWGGAFVSGEFTQ